MQVFVSLWDFIYLFIFGLLTCVCFGGVFVYYVCRLEEENQIVSGSCDECCCPCAEKNQGHAASWVRFSLSYSPRVRERVESHFLE